MADDKDKKIGEVPHLENVTGKEKIPVSADGEPRYVEIQQIRKGLLSEEKAKEEYQPKGKYQPEGDYLTQEEGDKRYATSNDIPNVSDFLTSKQAAQKYYPKVDGDNLTTQLETLDFTVETLNQGLGEAEQRIEEVEQCNVIAEEVIDDDTLPDFGKLTREELKKDLFIDLWNEACGSYGKYNSETGYFELYSLKDLTFEDAVAIYNQGVPLQINSQFSNGEAKSHLPQVSVINYELRHSFWNNYKIIEIYLPNARLGSYSLYLCDATKITVNSFFEDTKLTMKNLEDLTFTCADNAMQRFSFDFNRCTKLKIQSLQNTIRKIKSDINSITIGAPLNIYNAILGQETEYPFNGGTQEEWTQLLQDATEKNIQFATA